MASGLAAWLIFHSARPRRIIKLAVSQVGYGHLTVADGIEPPTSCVKDRCSYQLSYACKPAK